MDAARREGQLAGTACDDGIADLEGQLALHDVEQLVEVVMMQRRAGEARTDAVVHHRDAPRPVVAANEDIDAARRRRQHSRRVGTARCDRVADGDRLGDRAGGGGLEAALEARRSAQQQVSGGAAAARSNRPGR